MIPTSSSTLSQGLFSRNSHLQRFRTVVCLQLPAVMQQSHRRRVWLWLQGMFQREQTQIMLLYSCVSGTFFYLFSKFQVGFAGLIIVWVVVSNIFNFHIIYLGKWSNLTHIFQMGWNHQPVVFRLENRIYPNWFWLQLPVPSLIHHLWIPPLGSWDPIECLDSRVYYIAGEMIHLINY